MAARVLLLCPASPGPSPDGGGQCSWASAGEERGRHWPFPSWGHLAGGDGGWGDKGADVGDASTLIMKDGPTHTADLGWPAPLRQEAPLPQAPGASSLGSASHAPSAGEPWEQSSDRSRNTSWLTYSLLCDLGQVTNPL